MKGMPLPFDFEGKGVFDLGLLLKNKGFGITDSNPAVSSYLFQRNCFLDCSFGEPTSMLDSAQISSRRASSSTLSSSLGGGGGGAASTDTAGVAAVSDTNPSSKWQQESTTATSSNAGGADSGLLPVPPSLEIGGGDGGNVEKCSMEDWEAALPESVAASPSQEQSIFRYIMGDVEDPAMGNLSKVFQIGGGGSNSSEFEFSGGFGFVDQGFPGDQFGTNLNSTISSFANSRSSAEKLDFSSNQLSANFPSNLKPIPDSPNVTYPCSVPNNLAATGFHHPAAFDSSTEMKPPIFNPQLLINQHQARHAQSPSFYLPFSYAQQQEQSALVLPQAKRHNPGGSVAGGIEPQGHVPKGSFWGTGQQEVFMGRQQLHPHQQQALPHQLRLLPHHLQQRPKPKVGMGDEVGHGHQQHQPIIDQLYKAAELVQTGNPVLAQGILARLNHQLSPIGNPFQRAAFYCKEALQSILLHNGISNSNPVDPSTAIASPFSLIFKISAYKSFSEVSPLVPFVNFTCNQALLEAVEGFDQIHVVDFDIGYGGQWASLMQELALRGGSAPALKITALVSLSVHDQLELSLIRENLIQFAAEINIGFEFEVIGIDNLHLGSCSLPFQASANEAVAVNLPIGCLVNYELSVPLALRFVKQLSPRIVVSVDRGCDRADLPFANHIIHALQSHSNLLESLDAVNNVNMDSLQKIEKFLLQPGIEKIVTGRIRSPERSQHWRSQFLSSGFSHVAFSNFTESQAECVLKRTPVRGFHVEKRQSSLVLCWQRKELVSASVWKCS